MSEFLDSTILSELLVQISKLFNFQFEKVRKLYI
jgi:hypothetical protein